MTRERVTQVVFSGQQSRSLSILDLDTSINVAKDYRCLFFSEGTANFLTHCATGKHSLIRITLMGTKNLYCEGGGARGKLLDHSLERGPGHHTLAKSREPLGADFISRMRQWSWARDIYSLLPLG